MSPTMLRIAVIVSFVVALAAMPSLPLSDFLYGLVSWMQGWGRWAPILLVAAYVVASFCFIPVLILSIGAGFLFGIPLGIATVSIGSTLGATAAFLVARTWGRQAISSMIAGNPRFVAIDGAVAREGFKVVLLSRLSPFLSYNLLNYALGLTTVTFADFVLASWIGMLPITFLYVYLGSTLSDMTDFETGHNESPFGKLFFVALGLAATLALVVVLANIRRKALPKTVIELPDQ